MSSAGAAHDVDNSSAAEAETAPAPRSSAPGSLASSTRGRRASLLELVAPWRVLALLAALGGTLHTIRPIRDPDIFWHVEAGREIVRERSLAHIGDQWTFGPADPDWKSTQWLSELVITGVHALAGWEGITIARLVLALAFYGVLARVLLRRPTSVVAAITYLAVVVASIGAFEERPQLVSLLFLPWLAGILRDVVVHGRDPHWSLLLLVWLWANLHGLWVLAPASLGIVAAGLALNGRSGLRRARTIGLWTLGTLAAGALTPVGPELLWSPIRFAGRTSHIVEWQHTTYNSSEAMVLGLMVAVIVVCWARSPDPVEPAEILLTLAVAAFAVLAVRNVFPAVILLAPITATRATGFLPYPDAPPGRVLQRLLGAAGGVAAIGLVVAIALVQVRTDALTASQPDRIGRYLAQAPAGSRVFADYNITGALIHWGEGRTRLFIDGRADRYDPDVVNQYLALLAGVNWERDLARMNVEYAVLASDVRLAELLRQHGWRRVMTEEPFVLLQRPDAAERRTP